MIPIDQMMVPIDQMIFDPIVQVIVDLVILKIQKSYSSYGLDLIIDYH